MWTGISCSLHKILLSNILAICSGWEDNFSATSDLNIDKPAGVYSIIAPRHVAARMHPGPELRAPLDVVATDLKHQA
jgi:hypothetical protein